MTTPIYDWRWASLAALASALALTKRVGGAIELRIPTDEDIEVIVGGVAQEDMIIRLQTNEVVVKAGEIFRCSFLIHAHETRAGSTEETEATRARVARSRGSSDRHRPHR